MKRRRGINPEISGKKGDEVVSKQVLIMGVGSPVAGDEAGLLAVRLLQQRLAWCDPSLQLKWLARERPGLTILDDWAGMDCVVLIDAMISDEAPAGVSRIEPRQLIAAASPLSSHSVGVAESLTLAEAIGALPPQLLIFGIAREGYADEGTWLKALEEMLGTALGGRLRFGRI